MTEAHCGSCKAPIRWVKTKGGANLPLDPEPTAAGNIVLVDGVAVVLAKNLWETPPEGPRYQSHFASCPSYKRKKNGKQ